MKQGRAGAVEGPPKPNAQAAVRGLSKPDNGVDAPGPKRPSSALTRDVEIMDDSCSSSSESCGPSLPPNPHRHRSRFLPPRKRSGQSHYRGVTPSTNARWLVRKIVFGSQRSLGTFGSERAAGYAYDAACVMTGTEALRNFPGASIPPDVFAAVKERLALLGYHYTPAPDGRAIPPTPPAVPVPRPPTSRTSYHGVRPAGPASTAFVARISPPDSRGVYLGTFETAAEAAEAFDAARVLFGHTDRARNFDKPPNADMLQLIRSRLESKGFGKYMVAVSPVVADAEVPCPDASESTACQILSDAEASTQGCAELDTWPAVFTKPLIDLTSRRVPEEDKFGVSSDEDEYSHLPSVSDWNPLPQKVRRLGPVPVSADPLPSSAPSPTSLSPAASPPPSEKARKSAQITDPKAILLKLREIGLVSPTNAALPSARDSPLPPGQYLGVTKCKLSGEYRSLVTLKGKWRCISQHAMEVEAAVVRDAAVVLIGKASARGLNFPKVQRYREEALLLTINQLIEHGVTFRAEDLVSLASVMATPTSPPPEPRPIHPPAHHAPRDEDPIPVVVRSSMDALAVMARVDDAPINFRYFGIAPSNSMGWWVSRIHVPPPGYPFGSVPPSCRPLWLGTYSTPHIAAWVYDAAVRLLGLASTLPTNFISRTPPQHVMDSTRDKLIALGYLHSATTC